MELDSGKLNIIIDGQFGSTGKGLLASYVGLNEHIDIVVSNSSANAGHTFYLNGEKYITKQLPVAGIVQPKSTIYLCAGAIIHPPTLISEINRFDIDPSRIRIHPRAAIITEDDIIAEKEKTSSYAKLASTASGVGMALARKVMRSATLAEDEPLVDALVGVLPLHSLMESNLTCLMEVPQGFDLSLSSGFSYPHCTSREITVSSALSDAQVHPSFLGKVAVCLRTFPIRVGNTEHGHSGPFYPDSKEITWNDIGVQEEITTVTGRVRRVATFSHEQYQKMIDALRPDYIMMNFANYLNRIDLCDLLEDLPEISHLGFGPKPTDVHLNHYFN